MNEVKEWMTKDCTHEDMNCFALTIISHGTGNNDIMDRNHEKGWNIEYLIDEISDVVTLHGKPKLFFIEACRGGKQ